MDGANDWPTYRGNLRRSGSTETAVPAWLTTAWRSNIGGRPSSLVVAGGKVFAAVVDAHTIHALDAADGRSMWTFTAGARVDSPPTVYNGLAIFGSADGRVYCLRAADGALVWRFDAAPQRRLVTSFNQLESPWPVPGSVLERDGVIWFAAGRSSYLDGGICLFALDAQTGRVEFEKTIYSPDPKTGKMTPETSANQMPGLLNDIPGSDGTDVFIRQMNVSSDGAAGKPHLYSTRGFLDASWFNRTYWTVGRAQTLGLMVHGEGAAYGVEFSRSRNSGGVFTPGGKAYRLICRSLKAPAVAPNETKTTRGRRQAGGAAKVLWQQDVGIRVTALVCAGDALFAAGSPDVTDRQDPHGAWEGRKGGLLGVFAATGGGKQLAEYPLKSPPVWDGMAAARERLYVALSDGTIVCMQKVQN